MGGFTVLFSFQFPPLREGRQPVVRHALDGFPISIPAPARGATRPTTAIRTVITISIPAPARGATRWIPPPQPISRFQFPPLREGRPTDGMSDSSQALFQFPPLREGRQRFSHDFREISNFNSRPCARGDWIPVSVFAGAFLFQFPPLREGRLCSSQIDKFCPGYFNSRPCARGDQVDGGYHTVFVISIPAPARGATWRGWRRSRPV